MAASLLFPFKYNTLKIKISKTIHRQGGGVDLHMIPSFDRLMVTGGSYLIFFWIS